MIITVISLIGITTVISIWLYGVYYYRLEVVATDVERCLSNSIHSLYHQKSDNSRHKSTGRDYRNILMDDFVYILTKEYKEVDSIRMSRILDSLIDDRFPQRSNDSIHMPNVSRGFILPPFILEQIAFDDVTMAQLDSIFQVSLKDKDLTFSVNVILDNTKPNNLKRTKSGIVIDSVGMIVTRPIIVNRSYGEYLHARFNQPLYYVLSKMFWQIFLAVILIFGLVGTFYYLFWTINRQNKMALLRKSFVNNMTHELKTPVSIVTAGLEAISRYAAKGDSDRINKYLSISQEELAHLNNMIEKVLQLDIDEINGLTLHLEHVNMNLLISELIEISTLMTSKSINIKFESKEDDLYLNVDKSHLKNVLNNLIDNAIKYAKYEVDILIELEKKANYVVIKVTDQGIGIPKNYLKDVFDMFFRVPYGELYSVKGFGIGLAYVKQVVERHEGEIKVKSELGRGTTFIITIPIKKQL